MPDRCIENLKMTSPGQPVTNIKQSVSQRASLASFKGSSFLKARWKSQRLVQNLIIRVKEFHKNLSLFHVRVRSNRNMELEMGFPKEIHKRSLKLRFPESFRPMEVTYPPHLNLLKDRGPPWLKTMQKTQEMYRPPNTVLVSLGICHLIKKGQTLIKPNWESTGFVKDKKRLYPQT